MTAHAGPEPAPAKLNLFLHVTGRRDDGYHLVDSLIAFAGVGDRLWVRDSAQLDLTVVGPFADAVDCARDDNLVIRAARSLAAAADVPARGAITLEKNLPVAAGIGGGSSDAAAVLRLLDRYWGLDRGHRALCELAVSLGADVPVCLGRAPARVSGIGTEIVPWPAALPPLHVLLANPGEALATASVFKARTGRFGAPAAPPSGAPADAGAVAAWLADCRNDLEAPACRLAPVVAVMLEALRGLPGCLFARMSGSGATCFALFPSDRAAQAGRARLAADHPDWWLAAAPLLTGAGSDCASARVDAP